jgi:hypothetical protein
MSIKIMSLVFETRGMNPAEKLVALALADHAHDDGTEARPGQTKLIDKTELSESTVRRAIKGLLTKQIIEVQRAATSTLPVCYRFRVGGVRLTPVDDAVGGVNLTVGGVTVTGGGCHHDTQTINEPSEESLSSDAKRARPRKPPVLDSQRLCDELAKSIENNGSKRPTVSDKWLNDMRLLLEVDKRSVQQVRNMIEWCQNDSFWRSNILSPFKLRAKYDQMRLKALSELEGVRPASMSLAENDRATQLRQEQREYEQRIADQHAESRSMPESMKKLRASMKGNL